MEVGVSVLRHIILILCWFMIRGNVIGDQIPETSAHATIRFIRRICLPQALKRGIFTKEL